MLQSVIQALAGKYIDEETNASYYAEYAINTPKLRVSVDGIGKLDFPLHEDTIHNLLNTSKQAQFGWRDQTLTDTNIRDTQEISVDYLQVELENDFLTSMLEEVKQQLGLSDHVQLNAHLHNLLIYGAGQFFKPHRDSEKLDGMVATLVIVLPSPHIGGDLLINHKKEQHRFVSENINEKGLKCIAFYSDCYHEVEPIRQGYRVALTYNIVLQTTGTKNTYLENTALDLALKNYFGLPEADHVDKNLIYYFDHSYTEHSLRWDLLKGNDYHYARAFLNTAKKLDLVPHLALVEIHESWTTEEDNDYDSTPDELIDNSTSLNFWIDEHNQPLTYHYDQVDEEEVCWSTPTEDLEPDETQHEGYMGNYGNTVDYWYRRAAIVLWPKQAQIRMNFRLNHDGAMRSVFQLIQKQGNESYVLDIIKQADYYFHQSNHYSNPKKQAIEHYLQLALYIKDKTTALFVLNDHPLYALSTTDAQLLLGLQKQYGVEWCLPLFEQWKTKAKQYSNTVLMEDLGGLITAFISVSLDISLMNFLIDYQLETLMTCDARNNHARPVEIKKTLPSRLMVLQDVFHACVSLSDSQFIKQLVEYLISKTVLYPPTELVPFLISWKRIIPCQSTRSYQLLFSHVETAVQLEVSKGLRAEQDKSITPCLPCNCEHCKNVSIFLQSPTESIKTVAIREDIRRHIMSSFSGLGLPVSLSEVRTGSPYKLVIKKDDTIFQIAKERFDTVCMYQHELGLREAL
jgi:hypothetical protein